MKRDIIEHSQTCLEKADLLQHLLSDVSDSLYLRFAFRELSQKAAYAGQIE